MDNEEVLDTTATEEKQATPYKTFESQSDLDSYTDKRVAKALETARSKWNNELDTKLKEREDEAKRLASMNAKDRAEAKLKSREEALKQREHELDMKAYRIEAQKQLEEQKLPADLVDLVLTDDAEKTHSNIQKLAESVDMLVKARVEELSKTDSPRESAGFKVSDNSMNDIASFAQANRLIK